MTSEFPIDAQRSRETVLPPHDATQIESVAKFLTANQRGAALTAPDGTSVPIPREVFDVLVRVAAAMAQDAAVTVAPVSTRLTTSQAAEILGVSRPTLIRLLEDGAIPYEQPRRHRVLRLDDVLAFQKRRRAEQRAFLADATRQAVADGLYSDRAADYAEALRAARHSAG
ncbi:MAG: helix-turn-helix domain-containing protein [Bifidobacteriaceae bacterium]|jgi:excisionase family DNA binding protein|nr:helix-turn-helix domain-containing protein [Bifidobacteriaceae bacterium]